MSPPKTGQWRSRNETRTGRKNKTRNRDASSYISRTEYIIRLVASCLYNEYLLETDTELKRDYINGLFPLLVRVANNHLGNRSNNGTVQESSDLFRLWLMSYFKNQHSLDTEEMSVHFLSIKDNYDRLFKEGHAYDVSEDLESIIIPVQSKDSTLRYSFIDTNYECPCENGYPHCFVDYSYYNKEAGQGEVSVGNNCLQRGTVWIRNPEIMNRMMNLIGLATHIKFDENGPKYLDLDDHLPEIHEVPLENPVTKKNIIVLGDVPRLNDEWWNNLVFLKPGERVIKDSSGSHRRIATVDDMTVRYYSMISLVNDPLNVENNGDMHISDLRSLVEDIIKTDERYGYTTLFVIGRNDEEVFRYLNQELYGMMPAYVHASDIHFNNPNEFLKDCRNRLMS